MFIIVFWYFLISILYFEKTNIYILITNRRFSSTRQHCERYLLESSGSSQTSRNDQFWLDSKTMEITGSKTLASAGTCLSARHAKFNGKSDIFGLQNGLLQIRPFLDRWSRGTNALSERLSLKCLYDQILDIHFFLSCQISIYYEHYNARFLGLHFARMECRH